MLAETLEVRPKIGSDYLFQVYDFLEWTAWLQNQSSPVANFILYFTGSMESGLHLKCQKSGETSLQLEVCLNLNIHINWWSEARSVWICECVSA